MKRWLLGVLGMLLLLFSTTVQADPIAARIVAYGCITESLFDSITNQITSGDKEGAMAKLASFMATGACTMFEKGDPIVVTDRSPGKSGWLPSGMIKVRSANNYTEYWTLMEIAN